MRYLNFDRNAGYVDANVCRQTFEQLDKLSANPSSTHSLGQKARLALEESREVVKNFLGLGAKDTLFFTSGATEGNNACILHPFWDFLNRSKLETYTPSVVALSVEHPSVSKPLEKLNSYGVDVRLVAPNINGEVDPIEILNACDESTRLVSVMLANNETGNIYPVKEISELVKSKFSNILVHTDAAQAVGKMPVCFSALGADLLTISGHKIGALSGVGAVALSEGVAFNPLLHGGAQEGRLRAGTENILGVVSLAVAVRKFESDMPAIIKRMQENRDLTITLLKEEVPSIKIHCEGARLLPNTINARVPGLLGEDMVMGLDLKGVAVSAGSACSAGKTEMSQTIFEITRDKTAAREAFRISFCGDESKEEIRYLIDSISEIARRV